MSLKNGKNGSIMMSIDSQEYLYSVLDTLFCGVILIDNSGNIVECNTSAKNLLCVESDESESLCGTYYIEFKLLKDLSRKVDVVNSSGRFIAFNGTNNVICNINPLIVNDIRVGSILILHRSLETKCLMQELNVTESLLKEINIFLESSFDGFLVTDSKGKIIRVNSAFENIFSAKRRDILGRNISELLDKGIICESAALNVCKTQKQQSTIEEVLKGKKIISTGVPVFDENDKFSSVVVNVRDITELESLKEELEYQKILSESYSRSLVQLSQEKFHNPELIAYSKEMVKVLELVEVISEVDSTVLIYGETGVGKEIIVNEIYRSSSRKDGPIVKINCGAIPESLFESELFGYEEGAFTGARKHGKIGFFELANKGTLFLDEVGELNLDSQVKLLRAIQEGEITRVGGTKTIKVDVRIISATNKDLKEMMDKGEFRQDLYYRLNVINLNIPPLRERRDDIVPLSRFFVEKFNKKYKKNKTISMDLAKVLRTLQWYGNIRELENLMETLVVLVKGNILKPEHLPNRCFDIENEEPELIVNGIIPLKEATELLEKKLISKTLEKYPNMTKAAEVLGVSQSTISRKLKNKN